MPINKYAQQQQKTRPPKRNMIAIHLIATKQQQNTAITLLLFF